MYLLAAHQRRSSVSPPGDRGCLFPRTTPHGRRALSFCFMLAAAGCLTEPPTVPEEPRFGSTSSSISQAIVRVPERPSHDIAARVPSFGGYYLDGNVLVGLVSDPSDAPIARAELEAFWSSSDDLRSVSNDVVIREADFAFRELAEWRDLAYEYALGRDDVVRLDLDERRNRVAIGITDSGVVTDVEDILLELGIPRGAVVLERAADPVKDVTLRDEFRPARGGFEITTTDQFGIGPAGICTLGFSAVSGTKNVAFTASHCTDEFWDIDNGGAYQDTIVGGNFIGYENADPDWFDCDSPWYATRPCRYSDAANFEYMSTVDFDLGYLARTLGPPATGWGNWGSITIDDANPRWHITDKGDPIGTIHKVGMRTGWTEGDALFSCVDRDVNQEINGDEETVRLKCQYEADYYSFGGDSGSPVFRITGANSVTLVGLHWGRDTVQDRTILTPMSGLELDFGAFTISDVPPPLIAEISGPSQVQPNDPACTWYADVTGGVAPYSYQWSGVLSGTGSSVSGSPSSSGWLYLDVTDSNQDADGDDFYITVSQSASPCGI